MSSNPTPKRMSWGDTSRPRPTTEAYREGMDRIHGNKDEIRREKQKRLYEEAQKEKARIKKLLES